MKGFSSVLGLCVMTLVPVSMAADHPPANCKPLNYMGVSGCELLPDRTCPKGYHIEAVGPSNPQMKAPSRLMCVPDKPSQKKPPAKETPKPERDITSPIKLQ